MNKLIIKDISNFEQYEDWWNYEFSVQYLFYKNKEIEIECWCYLEDLLTAVLNTLKIPYREQSDDELDNFPELDYEKYLISVLEQNNFEVLFEAHDDLIKYETKGVSSIINPKYKKLSDFNNFVMAEDIYYNPLEYIFKGIEVEEIISYIKISSNSKKSAILLSDKIFKNVLNTFSGTLSFHKMLFDKL